MAESDGSNEGKNPHFGSAENGYFQLFQLLPMLKWHPSTRGDCTDDAQLLEAIHQHAENSVQALITGMQAANKILAIAMSSEDSPPEKDEIRNFAWLMQQLGDLLDGCLDLERNSDYALNTYFKKAA